MSATDELSANGQRNTQNDFILDGVDNNSNEETYQNGDTYNVRPPPDALAEFKLETSNYSAEYGHSSGAVLSASIKSGTNHIHGDLWEYVRNTDFDAADWDLLAASFPYTMRTSSAPRSAPIWKNKLFYFGDCRSKSHRLFPNPSNGLTTATASVRTGDLSEYFNTSINYVYQSLSAPFIRIPAVSCP